MNPIHLTKENCAKKSEKVRISLFILLKTFRMNVLKHGFLSPFVRVWSTKVSERSHCLTHNIGWCFTQTLKIGLLMTGIDGKGKCEIKTLSPSFAFYFNSSVSSSVSNFKTLKQWLTY